VQASVRESFGIAALEARTAGLAIVSRSQAGSSDFVTDGVEGLLGDEDADLVSALLKLQADRDLLDSIIDHNTSVPPIQAWPNVLDQVQRAYDTARGVRRRALG
jgi:phosphatidylinositol alpha 1,6-mannosyltransferase